MKAWKYLPLMLSKGCIYFLLHSNPELFSIHLYRKVKSLKIRIYYSSSILVGYNIYASSMADYVPEPCSGIALATTTFRIQIQYCQTDTNWGILICFIFLKNTWLSHLIDDCQAPVTRMIIIEHANSIHITQQVAKLVLP